jgi:hypothetical protein
MVKQSPLRRLWCITAWLVMWQLVVVQALAASPELHECCHEHSQLPSHECAVTLMLQGGYAEVLPDIVPVELSAEPPSAMVALPVAIENEAAHFTGEIIAQAPPRGP